MTSAVFCFTLAVTLLLSTILLSNGEIKAAISEILDLAADGKLERVAVVLSENSDAVNYRNHLGFTPLIMATSNGHLELVKYLLGQRAEPNTVENDLWSPLMFAAYRGYTEIAFELFTAGANPLLRNKNGVTAHEIARNRENLETSRVIGEESVLYAIAFGSLDDVMLHIRLGVNPNLQNSVGWTPLMVASSSQSYDATLELINLGANVNMQERDGWTALLFAAHNGNRDIAELLVKSGADVNHKTKDQRTALQQATTQQHREVVQFLQNYGEKEEFLEYAAASTENTGAGNDVDQVEPTIQPVVTVSTTPEKPQKKKKRFLGIF